MKWENFTAERIASYKCRAGKKQTIYWDGKTPGLGLRVTSAGSKSYIFETSLHYKTIRMTIGDPRAWKIADAQTEATRLKRMTDQGIDPRQVIADARADEEAKAAARAQQEARETVTVAKAWEEYIAARKHSWGVLHLNDHIRAMHLGGEPRKRSKALTVPGILASFAPLKLVDFTPELVIEWAKVEGGKRQTSARKGQRLLGAFIAWCSEHKDYSTIVTGNAARNMEAKRYLGKSKAKNGALQREQLPAWFAAVKQIPNRVISAYLQVMLLTGARPNEIATARWEDVDFQWKTMTINDKEEGLREIPLPPYISSLLMELKYLNEVPPNVRKLKGRKINDGEWRPSPYVFFSRSSKSGHIVDVSDANNKACAIAGVDVTPHDLRRSFATLSEWIEMPAGIAAQIQGHKPQGVREQHYIRRPLDLLRMWHVKIEAWILEQANIAFEPAHTELRIVASA